MGMSNFINIKIMSTYAFYIISQLRVNIKTHEVNEYEMMSILSWLRSSHWTLSYNSDYFLPNGYVFIPFIFMMNPKKSIYVRDLHFPDQLPFIIRK
jgi:hypothetical protein